MLFKRITDKYYDNILNYVVTASGGGKVSLASHTWAELAGVHDKRESAAAVHLATMQKDFKNLL